MTSLYKTIISCMQKQYKKTVHVEIMYCTAHVSQPSDDYAVIMYLRCRFHGIQNNLKVTLIISIGNMEIAICDHFKMLNLFVSHTLL